MAVTPRGGKTMTTVHFRIGLGVMLSVASALAAPVGVGAQDASSPPSAAPAGMCPADAVASTSASPSAAGTTPTPGVHRFSTDAFDVDFVVPPGWEIGVDAPNALQLIGPGEEVFVNVAQLDAPIDPDHRRGRRPVRIEDCAAAFIDWLGQHPYLESSEPTDVTVGDLSGSRIDVTFQEPPRYRGGCGPGCLVVLRVVPEPAEIDRILMDDKEMDRYIAIDLNGSVLLFDIWTPESNPATGGDEARFEAGLAAAQEILDSVTVP
jgi:hypothetical protein